MRNRNKLIGKHLSIKGTVIRVDFKLKDMVEKIKTVMYKDGNRLGTCKRLRYSEMIAEALEANLESIESYKRGDATYEETFLSSEELNKLCG